MKNLQENLMEIENDPMYIEGVMNGFKGSLIELKQSRRIMNEMYEETMAKYKNLELCGSVEVVTFMKEQYDEKIKQFKQQLIATDIGIELIERRIAELETKINEISEEEES